MNRETPDPGGLSRRRALQIAGAGAVAGTAGALLPATTASAHGEITSFSTIWNQRTVYEVSGALASFGYRTTFHTRLNTWLAFWEANSIYAAPLRVWTYGAHTDSRVSEAHNNGRGFDLSRIYATNTAGHLTQLFNGRYDQWNGSASAALTRRYYFATAASAHYHFQHVLTYLYNADHHNHIHIDNLVSGTANSNFSTGSTAQVQHVQACCRYIWGHATGVDGIWGPQTKSHSDAVLARIGRSGSLTTSQANWLNFNRASCRMGYGVQTY